MTLSHSWMSRPVVSKTLLKSSLVQLTGTLPMNILVGFLSKIVRAKLFVEGGFFKDSRDGEFDFEPLPLVRQPS